MRKLVLKLLFYSLETLDFIRSLLLKGDLSIERVFIEKGFINDIIDVYEKEKKDNMVTSKILNIFNLIISENKIELIEYLSSNIGILLKTFVLDLLGKLNHPDITERIIQSKIDNDHKKEYCYCLFLKSYTAFAFSS